MKQKLFASALITLLLAWLLPALPARASEPLQDKLSLAQLLLERQLSSENLQAQTYYGFTLETAADLGYSLKNASGDVLHAYIQQTSRRVFFVEFYETGRSHQELLAFLPTLHYTWIGSEKGCDYLNNGHLALTLCPQSGKGVRVCVNLMPQ